MWFLEQLMDTIHLQLGQVVSGTWAANAIYRALGASVGHCATFIASYAPSIPDFVHIGAQ